MSFDYGQPHPLPPRNSWIFWIVGLLSLCLGGFALLHLIHM